MKKDNKRNRQNRLLREMIVNARERVGLTQAITALRLGVPQTFISKIELDQRRVELLDFLELVEVLECDPIDFLKDFINRSNFQESTQEETVIKKKIMQENFAYISELVKNEGPEPDQYEVFGQWAYKVALDQKKGTLAYDDIQKLRSAFGDALSLNTLYGRTLLKPHGYSGDFELLDKIYRSYINEDPRYVKWDKNYNSTETAVALRDRKEYFIKLLEKLSKNKKKANVLNIGSGPGRDLYDFFSQYSSDIQVDCLESEEKAIHYASYHCRDYLSQIKFYKSNASRFKSEKKYDLIWSANLLDNYDDKRLPQLLKRLLNLLAPCGQLVVSGFNDANPSRSQMEILGNWYFHHRSERLLSNLVNISGGWNNTISISGINQILHIQN